MAERTVQLVFKGIPDFAAVEAEIARLRSLAAGVPVGGAGGGGPALPGAAGGFGGSSFNQFNQQNTAVSANISNSLSVAYNTILQQFSQSIQQALNQITANISTDLSATTNAANNFAATGGGGGGGRSGLFGGLGRFGRLFGAYSVARDVAADLRSTDEGYLKGAMAEDSSQAAMAYAQAGQGRGPIGSIMAEAWNYLGKGVDFFFDTDTLTPEKAEQEARRAAYYSHVERRGDERRLGYEAGERSRSGYANGGDYGEQAADIENRRLSEQSRLQHDIKDAEEQLGRLTDPKDDDIRSARQQEIQIMKRQLSDNDVEAGFRTQRLSEASAYALNMMGVQGEAGLLSASGQEYTAKAVTIARRYQLDAEKERDPLRASALYQAALADANALDIGAQREGGITARRTGLQAQSLRSRTAGAELQSAQESINAKFLPMFDSNGRIVGFQGMDTSDPTYGEQFKARRDLYRAESAAAGIENERRNDLRSAEIRSNSLRLSRQPLDAELAELTGQRRAALEGITDPSRRREINDLFNGRDALARQQRADATERLDIRLQGEAEQTRRLLDRDTVGAQAEGIRAAGLESGTTLAQQGFGPQAALSFQNTQQQLKLLQQQYTDAFKATAIDLRLMDVSNPRDSQDPSKVLAEIRDAIKNIQTAAQAIAAKVQN